MNVSEMVGRIACTARELATPQNPDTVGVWAPATGSQACPIFWLNQIAISTTPSAATADGVLNEITERPCHERSDTLYCRDAV